MGVGKSENQGEKTLRWGAGSGSDRSDTAKVDVGAASEVEPGERCAGAQRRHTHHAPTTSEIQMRQLTANAEGCPRVRVRVAIIVAIRFMV